MWHVSDMAVVLKLTDNGYTPVALVVVVQLPLNVTFLLYPSYIILYYTAS